MTDTQNPAESQQRPGNGQIANPDVTDAVLTARSGLRRDVERLIERLESAELFTPLARSMPGVPEGEHVELADEITIVPHMLVDDEGHVFCALFTRPELMEPFGSQLGWETDGGPLQYVVFPARTALDMAVNAIDETTVLGVVINAGDPSELMLRRAEVGAILQRRPIPLVGYVSGIPASSEGDVLHAEPNPPPALVAALEACIARIPAIEHFEIRRVFDAERDTEPHLALHLSLSTPDVDRGELVGRIIEEIQDKLPPPGYIDILFED